MAEYHCSVLHWAMAPFFDTTAIMQLSASQTKLAVPPVSSKWARVDGWLFSAISTFAEVSVSGNMPSWLHPETKAQTSAIYVDRTLRILTEIVFCSVFEVFAIEYYFIRADEYKVCLVRVFKYI